MRDGSSPEYYSIGVIVIIVFFIFTINRNKKEIENGNGDKVDTHDYWGNSSTHKDNFKAGKITFTIILLVLLYKILTK
ncbi:MAG: hypothetical protein KKB34_12560 [Bacteroidetes bacterium]|nr:hypothetical protein [Bacteroidota bacterium]